MSSLFISCLVWIRRETCTDQAPFKSQNSNKKICHRILIWEDNRRWTFLLEGVLLWIMDSYFGQKWQFEFKTPWWWICFLQTCSFSLHRTSIDGLEWCGLLVDYCDVFISCLDSHSDGTHSLQRIHWWGSDVMLQFFKYVLMKNKLIYFLDGLRVNTFSANFFFLLNYSLNNTTPFSPLRNNCYFNSHAISCMLHVHIIYKIYMKCTSKEWE